MQLKSFLMILLHGINFCPLTTSEKAAYCVKVKMLQVIGCEFY